MTLSVLARAPPGILNSRRQRGQDPKPAHPSAQNRKPFTALITPRRAAAHPPGTEAWRQVLPAVGAGSRARTPWASSEVTWLCSGLQGLLCALLAPGPAG